MTVLFYDPCFSLKKISWICFQMPVINIKKITGLFAIVSFLISTIRFQSKQFNCCYLQQIYLAALFVL